MQNGLETNKVMKMIKQYIKNLFKKDRKEGMFIKGTYYINGNKIGFNR